MDRPARSAPAMVNASAFRTKCLTDLASIARGQNQRRLFHARSRQQPRQIDPTILATLASSRSMAGLVPSSGPFIGPSAVPDDGSAATPGTNSLGTALV